MRHYVGVLASYRSERMDRKYVTIGHVVRVSNIGYVHCQLRFIKLDDGGEARHAESGGVSVTGELAPTWVMIKFPGNIHIVGRNRRNVRRPRDKIGPSVYKNAHGIGEFGIGNHIIATFNSLTWKNSKTIALPDIQWCASIHRAKVDNRVNEGKWICVEIAAGIGLVYLVARIQLDRRKPGPSASTIVGIVVGWIQCNPDLGIEGADN